MSEPFDCRECDAAEGRAFGVTEAALRGQLTAGSQKGGTTGEPSQVPEKASALVVSDRPHLLAEIKLFLAAIQLRKPDLVVALERANSLLLLQNRKLEEANRRLRRHALEMERQATTDPLTGLLNRRAIEAVAGYEVCRRARHPGPLALGLIDADHFKSINTRHLLPGGDQALIGLARALAGSLRATDRVGRFGGEEFLVVAPHTDTAGATALAERLRAAVEQTPVSYNGEVIAVTVSIGFAVAEVEETGNYNELRHVAATSLADAKAAGRNCCVIRALGSCSRQPS
jgi:diguanylate cyclase (GGDEF)-like protein